MILLGTSPHKHLTQAPHTSTSHKHLTQAPDTSTSHKHLTQAPHTSTSHKHQAWANRFVNVCRFSWYQCSDCLETCFVMLVENAIFWLSVYSENDRYSVHTFTLQGSYNNGHWAFSRRGVVWKKLWKTCLSVSRPSVNTLLKFKHSCVRNASNFASSVDRNSVWLLFSNTVTG